MRSEVRATLKGLGTTAILVTHDQEEALSCGDLVAVMRDGAISQAGTPRELYSAPCDPDVARFLGEANILPARLADAEADTQLGPLRLRCPRSGQPCDGLVVLRPEELRIASVNGSGPPNAIVTAVEFYGHDARVELTCSHPDGDFELIARTSGAEAPEVGQRVHCSPCANAHAIH
jgi:iron(III) transport system ATP-binding protein